jgi:hypothetical protein
MYRQVFATQDYASTAGGMELSFKRGDVIAVHQERKSLSSRAGFRKKTSLNSFGLRRLFQLVDRQA